MPFQLFKKMQDASIPPVLLLIGEDPFLRQKFRQQLVEKSLGAEIAFRDMNFSRFLASEDDIKTVIQQCRSYPCFAEKRVVVLSDMEKVKAGDAQVLIAYLHDPQTTTFLLLEASKADGRLDWVKAFKKQSALCEIPSLKDADAMSWLRKCLQREAKSYEDGVAEAIFLKIGPSLGALEQAVTQLTLFCADKAQIHCDDVNKLFAKTADENIFAVIDNLFSGKREGWQEAFTALLQAGEAPLKILSLVARHISILLALNSQKSDAELQAFRLPPWIRKSYEEQLRRYRHNIDYRLLQPIAELDLQIKNGHLRPEFLLKNCFEQIESLLGKR